MVGYGCGDWTVGCPLVELVVDDDNDNGGRTSRLLIEGSINASVLLDGGLLDWALLFVCTSFELRRPGVCNRERELQGVVARQEIR